MLKNANEEAYENYKNKTIGDLTNTKNIQYMQKLKNEFKESRQILMKKNVESIRKVGKLVFDSLMQMSILPKMHQNQYQNISDVFADFNYVEQEYFN